jgi:hypothetical protein
VRRLLAGSLALAAATACSLSTEGELNTFAGEWCTLRGLASGGYPQTAQRYVSMVLVEEGSTILGSGSSKRRNSDVVYPARYSGTRTGDKAVISASDLDPLAEAKGPAFTLTLRIEGVRDLEGTISGDAGLDGPITLVRLGPRCFFE